MAIQPTSPADLAQHIATQLELPHRQIQGAVELLHAGNTIPFIARYRKEATQGLDEVALRAIEDALERHQALQARKTTVLKTISEQGLLTDALRGQIHNCLDLRALENIYLPFKPKRRTRATRARAQGLQPLADLLLQQEKIQQSKQAFLQPYVDASPDLSDTSAALQGALDIIAEQWSEKADIRAWLVEQTRTHGHIVSQVKRGKQAEAENFSLYLDHQEPLRKIPSHRLLAMLRGAAEGILRVRLHMESTRALATLRRQLVHNPQFEFHRDLLATVQDCYQRLLWPATESTVLQALKEEADQQAICVFGKNLRELLMAPPAGPRVTLGIDPGFRTGCKLAVIDGTGKFLAHTTIYPTPPKKDLAGAGKALLALLKQHQVELIAIGNGTASRETDVFVGDLIREQQLKITKVLVSEAGASIYSASALAAREFPDLDLTIRGAISIARRLQDPLAELVKSDPKSIGVGQYQHDVNQKLLRKCLDRVVASCVNQVGVDLNRASVPLLSHVAGIGPRVAENIVAYRDTHGPFTNRQQLTSVAKLGKKAFLQAAGFLRIDGGDQPLDNSAVHPESYPLVSRMAQQLHTSPQALVGNATLSARLQPADFVDAQFGMPTIMDILTELSKPGRDPRRAFRAVQFSESIHELADLKPNLILEGVITNVTHFGAFVDIGVHQDGLIHISELSDEYVSDPNAIVAVGDVVHVKVLEIDIPRKRISLTRKFKV